jgi:hypothetical protein
MNSNSIQFLHVRINANLDDVKPEAILKNKQVLKRLGTRCKNLADRGAIAMWGRYCRHSHNGGSVIAKQ